MSTTSSTKKRYNTRNNKQSSDERKLDTDIMSAYRISSKDETSEETSGC
jgi:hypothetical protein